MMGKMKIKQDVINKTQLAICHKFNLDLTQK